MSMFLIAQVKVFNYAVCPPSTNRLVPVTKEDMSEAKKIAQQATLYIIAYINRTSKSLFILH